MNETSMMRRKALGALCSLALAGAPVGSRAATPFYSLPLSSKDWHKGFRLTDLHGHTKTPQDYRGNVLLLFFGFLSCPSICSTTMLELTQAKERVGAQKDKVKILFVTLDPNRDTSPTIARWLSSFGDDNIGLRDSEAHVRKAATALNLKYERVEGDVPGAYTIDHGVQTYVFDPQGRLRLIARAGIEPEYVAKDIVQLLSGR
ncbi:ahpC/TSA family protein [Burkholderia pseudomallei MSHR983]|uniref:SCO family protein n=1 Tax=Burkholderia pseudomallei TaxID=28450 RepID=UPI000538D7A5|nr:SCO family protein [Burkholderia pseudomallei]KGU64473.1 ahpC/TSA family protein [Burkholderia pseudomallei MSHR983]